MIVVQGVGIRKFLPEDLAAVGKIFSDTSFFKLPALRGNLSEDYRLYSFLGYYFFFEPDSIFLAYDKETRQVVGYICGALDYKLYNKILRRKIYPRTVLMFCRNLWKMNKESWQYLYGALQSYLKKEYSLPPAREFLQKYPAHLHINIRADYRRRGVGGKLMKLFEGFLQGNNVNGVFLRTFCRGEEPEGAYGFFSRQGFQEIFRKRISLQTVSATEKIFLVTMVKDLGV